MRTILAYEQGRAIWSENVPATPQFDGWLGGCIIEGGPGSVDRQRAAAQRHTARKTAQRRTASKAATE